MPATPKLVLYFDVVSPFAYLAYHVIRHSAIFAKCNVTYVPVFLGGIMKACGNTPPINIKNKGPYIAHERNRWARMFNIPLKEGVPPRFPANTLPVQRALTAVDMLYPDTLTEILDVLFHASFVDHQPVNEKECLLALLGKVYGQGTAEDIIQKSTSDEVKKQLLATTEDVISKGSFGLPWFIATNAENITDHFWGFDRIGLVASHIGLERPQPLSSGEKAWRAML